MKSEKGITLTSLVIYIIVATILIGAMASLSSFFFSNMYLIKDQDRYAPEFTKFNMFFIEDVKNNQTATIEGTTITFEDGTKYSYNAGESAIYRNDKKITELVQSVEFTQSLVKINNTTKQIITVNMSIGKAENDLLNNVKVEYVLKYW